ncbi:DNA-directed RNA polymerase [Listeria ivanovii]|uniref:DUF2004 domain-containing protein n=1 Tax=Listeria ivanovii TaxID=1638 RepID=UPI000DA9A83F|nr:DUF2004 domain-containing protein [Listeria ivanovii]MBC2254508.1 DUF2004 domain-containing protein [Listeria ivanovii]PZF88256.1 DNA-directed RNA polymerase [Listeria ivanovii]PZF92881.1 DNA-directed RNA polymerase [Listeria ivanovii]PZG03825.1 DNA-directed RNA polymerase [Listeria ivanovii]PZG08190.1 DNA-directed RNA polymerase [Listeria ivanovii]
MAQQLINTKLLGELTYDIEKGLLIDTMVVLDNKEIAIDFGVFENITLPEDYQNIARLTDQLPVLYQKAKTELLQQFTEGNATIDYYFEFHLEELTEDVLAKFALENLENITKDDLVKGLVLSQVWFAQNNKNELDLTFDFNIIPEYSDELLVVRFDNKGEITDIVHES